MSELLEQSGGPTLGAKSRLDSRSCEQKSKILIRHAALSFTHPALLLKFSDFERDESVAVAELGIRLWLDAQQSLELLHLPLRGLQLITLSRAFRLADSHRSCRDEKPAT